MTTTSWYIMHFIIFLLYAALYRRLKNGNRRFAAKALTAIYVILLFYFAYVKMIPPLIVTAALSTSEAGSQERIMDVRVQNRLPVELTFENLPEGIVTGAEAYNVSKLKINNEAFITGNQGTNSYRLKGFSHTNIRLHTIPVANEPNYLDITFRRLGRTETQRIFMQPAN